MRYLGIIGLVVAIFMLPGVSPAAGTSDPEQTAVGQTPPRLSFVDGQVSFWRPGDQDWSQAQLNTPLAPGDRLYTGSPGNLELQIGARAFARAWADTQLGLENQEPGFLRFEVSTGYAAFDLRTLEPGRTVVVDTPNASFTIEHAGYYRVDVSSENTAFITRRGGRAAVTTGGERSLSIAPGEEVVIEGTASPQAAFYPAAPLDEWDNWNYARTDYLLASPSARYIAPEIYGAADLDAYGTWRIQSGYGPVWVPTAVPPGWVPYSTGAWIMDPCYGWTWVDTEPWGWAPYHYGRWVFVDGCWGWAPGPVRVRPVYAPALVAFFGGSGAGVGVAVSGQPVVGWVALGWGEPLIPWWGPRGFIHRPWWGGWSGPRVVNNRVINRTTVVNVRNITIYRNAGVHSALVTVNRSRFGRGPIGPVRRSRVNVGHLRPLPTAPRGRLTPASLKPNAGPGKRPSAGRLKRTAAVPRPSRNAPPRAMSRASYMRPAGAGGSAHGSGVPQKREIRPAPLPRPGHGTVEHLKSDRAHAPAALKHKSPRIAEQVSRSGSSVIRRTAPQSRRTLPANRPATATPQVQSRPPEGPQPQDRRLAGEPSDQLPANRVEVQEGSGAARERHVKGRPTVGFSRARSDGS